MRTCFAFSIFLFAAQARAIPAPVSEDELAALSHVVVEGLVVSATYLSKRMEGEYAITSYRAELQVTRVIKGKTRPGTILTILWEGEQWIGKGEHPDGRAPQPQYLPCQVVRTYLSSRPKNAYVTTDWNGRRLLTQQPIGSPQPSVKQPTIRCLKGKAIVPPTR